MGFAPTIDFYPPLILPLTLHLEALVPPEKGLLSQQALVFQQLFALQLPFSLLSPPPSLLTQLFGPQPGSQLSTRYPMRLTQWLCLLLFLPELVLELSARILRKDLATI